MPTASAARTARFAAADGCQAVFYSITGDRKSDPAGFREDLEQLFTWHAKGAISPAVAHPVSLGEVAAYHRKIEEGGLLGKVVVIPDQRAHAAQGA